MILSLLVLVYLGLLPGAGISASQVPIFATQHAARATWNIGCIVFPEFQALDVFGPLDPLNVLSRRLNDTQLKIQLSIIAASLSPVSTTSPSTPQFIGEAIVPTHTFENPPEKLDVLIVPGGNGTRRPVKELKPVTDFIKHQYPKLRYLISVCTGATLLARAGVLDGRNATSNKAAWNFVKSTGPKVNWVPRVVFNSIVVSLPSFNRLVWARWVVDGNIWTTSGIAAGIDGMFAWIAHVWGEDVSLEIANLIEYVCNTNASWDPFGELWNTTGSTNTASLLDGYGVEL